VHLLQPGNFLSNLHLPLRTGILAQLRRQTVKVRAQGIASRVEGRGSRVEGRGFHPPLCARVLAQLCVQGLELWVPSVLSAKGLEFRICAFSGDGVSSIPLLESDAENKAGTFCAVFDGIESSRRLTSSFSSSYRFVMAVTLSIIESSHLISSVGSKVGLPRFLDSDQTFGLSRDIDWLIRGRILGVHGCGVAQRTLWTRNCP